VYKCDHNNLIKRDPNSVYQHSKTSREEAKVNKMPHWTSLCQCIEKLILGTSKLHGLKKCKRGSEICGAGKFVLQL
jgi:hypothetical protein